VWVPRQISLHAVFKLRCASKCVMRPRQSAGCSIIWKHIRGAAGGCHPSRRQLAVNMARLFLGRDGGSEGGVGCTSHDGVRACHLTSVLQHEECKAMNAIMHLRHVSLSKGGAVGVGGPGRVIIERDYRSLDFNLSLIFFVNLEKSAFLAFLV